MRPYLAVIKDSFREAFASRVLWVLLILILLFLLVMAPFGYQTVLPVRLQLEDVRAGLIEELVAGRGNSDTPAGHVAGLLTNNLNDRLQEMTEEVVSEEETLTEEQAIELIRSYRRTFFQLVQELNNLLYSRSFYDEDVFADVRLNDEGQELLDKGLDNLSEEETARLNRLAFDAAFNDSVAPVGSDAVSLVYLHWVLVEELPVPETMLQDAVSGILTLVVGWLIGNFGVFIAIMVTASIVPQMLDTGACDLLLSKPVARPLLLLSKFFGGCAFILLCTAFLNTGLWLIIGMRFGIWNTGLLWAILVFVFVFAIYYSVSTAAAMVWRSAIVSIVFAILFWAACFTVGITKSSLDTWFLDARRTASIMPAGDDLLVTNWEGVGSQWNDAAAKFDEVFRDRRQAPAALSGYPFLGPLYDAENDRLVAIRIPLRAGFMPSALAVAQREDDWVPFVGALVPGDAQSLMLDADGAIIVAGLDGIFRFEGNPTVDLQSMQQLGLDVEEPDEENTFVRVDNGTTSWKRPFDASIDRNSGRLAVVSGDEVLVLEENEESEYAVVESAERSDSASAVVGMSGDTVLLAREDGVIRILNRTTLNEQATYEPFGNNEPRDVVASPDGRWLAVQFHNRKVWLYDVEASAPEDPALHAQGDISAVVFDEDSLLYAGDGFGRIIQYNPRDGFKEMDRSEPEPDTLESTYQWVISPLYRVFPKPGEMDNLVAWLMTRQETIVGDEEESGLVPNRETQRVVLDIWQPLWSNLAFLTIMLTLTCVYFTRKEF